MNFDCSQCSINFIWSERVDIYLKYHFFDQAKNCDNRFSEPNIKFKDFFAFILCLALMGKYISINSGREPIIYLWKLKC